jgi:hypothetical protein
MSSVELRSKLAAQILAGFASQLSPNSAENHVKAYVELAVTLAKHIEEEAARSLSR